MLLDDNLGEKECLKTRDAEDSYYSEYNFKKKMSPTIHSNKQ